MVVLFQILSLILAIATTSFASPGILRRSPTATEPRDGMTNAERFYRGLPPLPPRALYNPTRVRRDPLPSSSPTIIARIAVTNKDTGVKLGYMRGSTVNTESVATVFSFRNPASASDLIELNDYSTGQHYSLYSYTNGYYVGPGSSDYLIMTTTTFSTPAGSAQQADLSKGPVQYSETTIWSIDPDTGVVTAQWVNPDGSQDQVYFLAYSASASSTYIIFTGDVAAYKAANPTRTYTQVTLTVSFS